MGVDSSLYSPPPGLEVAWPTKRDGSDGRWELKRDSFEARRAEGQVRSSGKSKSGQWSIQYLRNAQSERLASGELVVLGRTSQGALDIEYAEGRRRAL